MHPEILDVQEKMVRKIILELKDFDNLYYEVCNEPYFGDTVALRQWEDQMTGIVADAEKYFSRKHLISNNVANRKKLVPELRNNVSIYNFHYARPPLTVAMNYHLNRPIGDNETGFAGINDEIYRIEAWSFILAGGTLFNHLDYSFTTDNEDGSYEIEEGQPGGGSKTIRNQFRILVEFMRSLNYINMKPVNMELIRSQANDSIDIYGLAEEDKVIALYFNRKNATTSYSVVDIDLPVGSYTLIWTNTKSAGETVSSVNNHAGGWLTITSPAYIEDIALKVVREN
jgi:hypothetical protein